MNIFETLFDFNEDAILSQDELFIGFEILEDIDREDNGSTDDN